MPIDEVRVAAGTLVWRDPKTGEGYETPVTGGHAKLQWKPDWAMRWVALGVDYEMAGKDLIDSVKLSGEIARALGGEPPEGFNYELFLDEEGQKISKSKGNGLSIDDWLVYGTRRQPGAVHVQQAARGEAPVRRDDPAPGRRLSRASSRSTRARSRRRSSATRSGTSMPGHPPAAEARGQGRARRRRSPCSSTSRRWPTPRTRRCCGASSAATTRRSGRETHPVLAPPRRARARLFPRSRAAGQDLPGGHRARSARRSRTCPRPSPRTRARPIRRACRRWSTRSGAATSRTCRARPRARTGAPACRRPGSRTIYNVLFGEARGPRFGSFIALYGVAETRALIAAGPVRCVPARAAADARSPDERTRFRRSLCADGAAQNNVCVSRCDCAQLCLSARQGADRTPIHWTEKRPPR